MSLEEFHLLRPWWLLSLLPLAWLLWRLTVAGGADQAWQRVMDSRFLQRLMPEGAGRTARWPLVLIASGWLAGSLALAGPAWERLPQPVFQEQTPVVLTLAMTPSMQAADLAPSRLARARFELRDMLAARDEGRTGLVIYADEPFTVAPLTDDPNVIDAQVPVLKPDLMPGRGDRPDRAIAQAAGLLRQAGAPSGGIVLLTDSAGTAPEAAEQAAAQARAAGYPVSVLAVLPDGGAVPPALDRLAASGGGQVVRLTPDDRDIAGLMAPFAAAAPGQAQAEAVEAKADAWMDEGFWLILLPLALAPLAFRRGVIAMLPPAAVAAGLMLTPPGPAQAAADDATAAGHGFGWADLWARPDQQGAAALAAGDAATAAELFADPAWQAAAQYRAGDFGRAATSLADQQGAEAAYNRGNALARTGRLEEAIDAYDQALAEMPAHEDARFNRDLLQELLDRQQQQQQQDQQQSAQDQSGEGQEDQQQSAQNESGEGQEDRQQSAQNESGEGQEDQQQSAQNESGEGQEDRQQSAQNESGEGQEDRQQSAQDQSGEGQQAQQQSAQDQSGQEQQAQQQSARDQSGQGQQEQSGQEGPEDRQNGTPVSAETEAMEGEALGDRIDRAMQALLQPGADEPQVDEPRADAQEVAADLPGRRTEEDQAAEQWLARVRDDPGALLREKLRRKYLEDRYGENRQGGFGNGIR
ncbi:VWA domain-containing protein [Marinibaculum pumilum]|uniref:VWA domain-containing protein n=1 Tax=Marinibaculum pumilum TaxID=1766165 RepID=A0ABV7L5U5_9PROT